jgi:hypothetical protein
MKKPVSELCVTTDDVGDTVGGGQHDNLEPVGIHHPAVGGMGRQTDIVVGFLDEVLGSGALVVEPDRQVQGASMLVSGTSLTKVAIGSLAASAPR